MIRALLFAFLAVPGSASTPRDNLDPAFEKVPFDQWLAENKQHPFHWSAGVPKVTLSFHQRFLGRVQIRIDGRDLQTRRDGQLVFLIQITDSQGKLYQNHGVIDLSKLDENVKAANVDYTQRAFFLPGEYRAAVAILDSKTGEHSTTRIQLRVPPQPRDLPPGTWLNLPTVEFVGKEDQPDSWFLPEVYGHLQWAAALPNPAHISVILNITPHRTHSNDLGALLPTLKVITQSGSRSLSEHVEVIDIPRRRVAFNQTDVHDLDWPVLKESIGDSNTASIDIHSLSSRHHDAQFFVSQVRKSLRATQQPCVLVVLTPPVSFDYGEDMQQISPEALPFCRVIYIRYRAPTELDHALPPPFAQHGGGRPMGHNHPLTEIDELEGTLKPLNPKIFDVETPDGITRALAEIEKSLR